ncbi:MAG TPA: hypothetical protein VGK67_02745 [Myxococcales bacterium]|jgi:hypothetical protein
MRSALLAVVCLACLALSCRMDCGLGTSGVGCEASGGSIACRSNTDCSVGQFCNFVLERCPSADSGVIEVNRIRSSACEPALADTLGGACSLGEECAPEEACVAGVCSATGLCSAILACRSGCVLMREPHGSCEVCVCNC